ncbi:MAG: transcription-repair coupling factor [candidate division WOR-3 bacterium]
MDFLYQRFLKLRPTQQLIQTIENYLRHNQPKPLLATINNLKSAASLLSITLYRYFKRHLIYLLNDNINKQDIVLELSSFLSFDQLLIFDNQHSYLKECSRLIQSQHPCLVLLNNSDLSVKLPVWQDWQKFRFELVIGMSLSINQISQWLTNSNYLRVDLVKDVYEYSIRGNIIDIFPEHLSNPIRVELDGEKIYSLRSFDVLNQRSIEHLKQVEIFACSPSTNNQVPLISYFPKDSLIVCQTLHPDLNNQIVVTDQCINKPEALAVIDFKLLAPTSYFGNLNLLKSEINKTDFDYFLIISSDDQYQKLTEILGIKPIFIRGFLQQGFLKPDEKIVVLTEKEIYSKLPIRPLKRKFKGQIIDDLLSLHKGDFVVHIDYGIGIFEDVVTLKVDDHLKDFLLIKYAQSQKLYVPLENIGLIERYIGEDTHPPSLSIIGSRRWILTKLKVARQIEAYAQELITLYARRQLAKKENYFNDSEWQAQFETDFEYAETPDQLRAWLDVKKDLESPKPMDRLISGDAGFGKTEIALRAAFKVASNFKQVAILVPTTILAYQHYQTFCRRFARFPFRIEMLSRFVTPSNKAKIISDLRNGQIDIIIGTQALLNSKIKFKDLGLLIIDEEHKFGVKQKEQIKKLKANLDVLTITATPIPRTLYRTLIGIADISLINTPPAGRQDIITTVINWNDDYIRERIDYELNRGGQVLFIHNRIQTIQQTKQKLHRLKHDWRIALAHSKMSERLLAKIYLEFLAKKYDILVSTAIIESGIDMPNVNTIIIDRAELFGLADLHQLRGRVGRSNQQAYCIFIVPKEKTPESEFCCQSRSKATYQTRLDTILAYAQLGLSFRLAMRDLEMRGVGNILGTQQHGNIALIGFNLYQQMLNNAIAQLKGEEIDAEPILSLDTTAYIPPEYISDSFLRVAIYKRLLSIKNKQELNELIAEIQDRFGQYPKVLKNLFTIAEIRLMAKQLKISKVVLKHNQITIYHANQTVSAHGDLNTLHKTLTAYLAQSYR